MNMKKLVLVFFKYFTAIRFIPLIVFFYVFARKKNLFEERDKWYEVIYPGKKKKFDLFIDLLNLSEYRSVLYLRIGGCSKLISWLARGQYALCFSQSSASIKPGLIIHHGHSTRIGAKSIGTDCQIWHNVTVGTNKSHYNNRPTIGNNVKICTGSIVMGDILIGNNVLIGAGTILQKSVPDNCVVVGNPARIVKKDGVKVDIKL